MGRMLKIAVIALCGILGRALGASYGAAFMFMIAALLIVNAPRIFRK